MKKSKAGQRFVKAAALGMILLLFMVMAMGSGSSSSAGSSENKGAAEKEDTGTETVQTGGGTAADSGQDTEAVENGSGEESAPDGSAGAVEENRQDTAQESWEVGQGSVVTYTDSIGSRWIRIAVPVVNTGSKNLFLSSGTMDLEDADGHLVDSKSMVSVYPQVIKPGETAWYYEETILDEGSSSDLTVIPHVDVKAAKVDCVRYETSDVSFTDQEYGGIKVTGRVENTTEEENSMVYVVLLMYDGEENFIGQADTILTDKLSPGDKVGFSVTTFSSNEAMRVENIAQYRIYAYPFQFQF